MDYIYNIPRLKAYRQKLRNRPTKAECAVWEQLKCKKCLGLKFRRQFGIGPYILDFYCPQKRLAIEIDGPSHNTPDAKRYDEERCQYMEELGIKTIRFTNTEVYTDLAGVIDRIATMIKNL